MGARFQVLFHSPVRGPSHLSLTVLVRYRSSAVFSLAGWSPRVQAGFLVPRPTQVPASSALARPYGGVTLCAGVFQTPSGSLARPMPPVLRPRRARKRAGLGSSPFARRYWGNRCFLSLPPGTEMFQFPGFAPGSLLVPGLQPGGLPHSGASGSFRACRSPDIFAARCALLRLPKPRHPPRALASLSLFVNRFLFVKLLP